MNGSLGDRVYSPGAERMAAQQAEDGQLAPPCGAVSLDGLVRIGTAARPEAAVASHERRQKESIAFNEEKKQTSPEAHRC
jgi:hypothetical protein